MKRPVAHSLNSTWFWIELPENCCEPLKFIMKYISIQFCERPGHGRPFHALDYFYKIHAMTELIHVSKGGPWPDYHFTYSHGLPGGSSPRRHHHWRPWTMEPTGHSVLGYWHLQCQASTIAWRRKKWDGIELDLFKDDSCPSKQINCPRTLSE